MLEQHGGPTVAVVGVLSLSRQPLSRKHLTQLHVTYTENLTRRRGIIGINYRELRNNQLPNNLLQPPPLNPTVTSYPGRRNSRNRKLRARPPILIDTHARHAIIPRDARRLAVGNNAAITDVEARKQQVAAAAVLGAEGGPRESHARRLADEVRAELRLPRALDDEDVGAEDLAGGDLPVGVRLGAGGVDDGALEGLLLVG